MGPGIIEEEFVWCGCTTGEVVGWWRSQAVHDDEKSLVNLSPGSLLKIAASGATGRAFDAGCPTGL